MVERYSAVRVRGWDAEGARVELRARGWMARILQHEVDHLNVSQPANERTNNRSL